MRHRIATRAVAALTLVGLIAGCSGDEETDGTTPPTEVTTGDTTPEFTGVFPIGFIRPGPGLLSELSAGQQIGIDLALSDINDAGGVDGAEATLEVAVEPAGGDPTGAITELVAAGALALVGPTSSSDAIAARPTLTDEGAVACSASATAASVTAPDAEDPSLLSPVVRTALPDPFFAGIVGDELVARFDDPTTASVAIVARDDDYGRSMAGSLSASLIARSITTTVISYNPYAVIFGPQVEQVTELAPDAVVMVSYEESVRLLGELLGAGIAGDTIIGLDGAARPNLATSASADDPTLVDGVTVYATTGNLAFLERAAAVEGATDLAFSAQAYDCVVSMALASVAAGSTAAADIRDNLAAVTADGVTCTEFGECVTLLAAGEDINYDGPSGGIAFNADGDPGAGRVSEITVEGGELSISNTVDIDIRQQERDELLFASATFTTQLQQALTLLGFYTGPIDGVWSDELTAALAAFQASVGLPPTGVYDSATDAALREALGDKAFILGTSIADIQRALTALGYYSGPIDGRWNDETIAAVKALQADLGVPQTGIIDLATLTAIYELGLSTGSTTTTAPGTTAPGTTVPPTTPPTAPPTVPPTTPPATTLPPVPPTTVPPPDPSLPTFGEILTSEDDFSTLVAILVASGITDGLDPLKQYTLFAPNNDALSAITPPTDPLDPDQQRVVAWTLAGHLVEGVFGPAQLTDGTVLTTLTGSFITVSVDPATGEITLEQEGGTAMVVQPLDLKSSEGVIHAIDAVLPVLSPEPR